MPDEPRLPSAADAPARSVLPSDAAPGSAFAPVAVPGPGREPGHASVLPSAGPAPAAPAPTPAAAPPPQPLATGEHAAAGDARAERMRRVTLAGGFGDALPAGWGDAGGDWESVREDDPFAVLFLDYRLADLVTVPVVEAQHALVRAFWQQKEDTLNRGAGSARERIERVYGRDVAALGRRVDDARRRLVADGGIAREAAARHARRRAVGEAEVAGLVGIALADGLLTGAETESVLQAGHEAGLTRDEAAAYVADRLVARGFVPRSAPQGTGLAAQLLSVEWLTPARLEEERRLATERERERLRTPPLKFREGAAHSIAELIDLCDAYPREGREYLFRGYLEPWLATGLHEASLASLARDTRQGFAEERERGLELFVRALSARASRPATPVVVPEPAACSLGTLPVGATAAAAVRLRCEGRRLAWGVVDCDRLLRGLAVPETFTGPDAELTLTLDTAKVPPGRYLGVVAVYPEGGPPAVVTVDYTVVPLTLHADPPALPLGAIPFGASRQARVRVTTSPPGGRLLGVVGLSPELPGVALAGRVADAGADAELTIDTRAQVAGDGYRTTVRVATNAGIVDVPVTWAVTLSTARVALWTAALAAGAGLVAFGVRRWLGEAFGWLAGWHLTVGSALRAPSIAGALLVVAALAVLVWRQVDRRRQLARVRRSLLTHGDPPAPRPAVVRGLLKLLALVSGLFLLVAMVVTRSLSVVPESLVVVADTMAAPFGALRLPVEAAWAAVAALLGGLAGLARGRRVAGRPLGPGRALALGAVLVAVLLLAGYALATDRSAPAGRPPRASSSTADPGRTVAGPRVRVTAEALTVRGAPTPDGEVLGSVPAGTVMAVVDSVPRRGGGWWYATRVRRGARSLLGWVSGAYVRPVPSRAR